MSFFPQLAHWFARRGRRVVGFEQFAEDAAGVVGAGVGLGRQDDENAEIGCGRVRDLLGQDRGDLG